MLLIIFQNFVEINAYFHLRDLSKLLQFLETEQNVFEVPTILSQFVEFFSNNQRLLQFFGNLFQILRLCRHFFNFCELPTGFLRLFINF